MSGVVASAIAMMWAALVVELAGFAVDAVWHGLLHPDFEPVSRGRCSLTWRRSTPCS